MFKIIKEKEPEFFKDYKQRIKPLSWKDYSYEIKQELKNYMFEKEQGYFCPYCELVINLENSQIEHIKPKDKFPKLTGEYSNYLVGCTNSATCGQHKKNTWSDNFINPTVENPEDYLTYDIMTGEIIPKKNEGIKYEKAKETINILNLNNKKLCEARRTLILNKEYIDFFENFPSLKEYLKRNFL